MKRSLAAGAFGAFAIVSLTAAAFAAPSFDKDGKIIIPDGRDRWPMVGATYALSYEGDGGVTINTVRMDPESYETYVKTGNFPVGTMLDLEVRRPVEEIAPAKGGKTQGAVVGRSLHVKDEKAGPGKWTFYGYNTASKTGNPIPRSQACYSCHDEHAGTTDTVFMQFYPSLKEAREAVAKAATP